MESSHAVTAVSPHVHATVWQMLFHHRGRLFLALPVFLMLFYAEP